MERACRDCGRVIKTTSGLQRHVVKCLVRTGEKRRKIPRLRLSEVSEVPVKGPNSLLVEHVVEDADELDSPFDNETLSDSVPSSDSDKENADISIKPGKLSTSSSIRVQTYMEETGLKAGSPICAAGKKVSGPSGPKKRIYKSKFKQPVENSIYPFKSEIDYALAHWFFQAQCTKGAVDRFFQDKRLAPLHSGLSFQSAQQWLVQLERIPHGVVKYSDPQGSSNAFSEVFSSQNAEEDKGWMSKTVTVQSEFEDVEEMTYQIQYRGVLGAIRFLIGHPPFARDLAYTPIRQYNDNGSRIYTEMHTANWWWETQQKLPEGATVVPLLLATDKTVLTQHHGDTASWPVYLTIGNLSRQIRRKQTRPGSILLGFIPIVSSNTDDIKATIWHKALSTMLERKQPI